MSYDMIASDADMLGHPNHSVVVSIIKDVDDANATYGDPPKVELLISEVLKGNIGTGEIKAIWAPRGYDHLGGKNFEKWANNPLKGPIVGSKMILLGEFIKEESGDNKEIFYVSPRCRYPFSEEKRKWVLETIKQAKLDREKVE